MIHITKVVSKNIFMDIVAKFQNIVGLNLTGYEKMINKGIVEVKKELAIQNISENQLKWYRYEISQFTNGAMAILFYGEKKR